MNIACWSGPRNLSTAMMYAFGARSDFDVMDEPFYAAFLAETGADHPLAAEVMEAGETDPERVATACSASAAGGQPHVYQKHMTHHVSAETPRAWFADVTHMFLLRHPARVLASYAKKRENPSLDDLGFVQQWDLLEEVQAMGLPVVIIDSFDIRAAPEPMLEKLCNALGVPFDKSMLSWPAGGHIRDGVWATHWYDAVHRSTGFAGPEGPLPPVATAHEALLDAALPYYNRMKAMALTAAA